MVETTDGRRLGVGDRWGSWTVRSIIEAGSAGARIVFEDFRAVDGALTIVGPDGTTRVLPKTSEPTSFEPGSLYRGHSLADVLTSEHDLLGSELRVRPEDPDFTAVADCLAAITATNIHTFLGTARCADKVAVAYGGATSNFDAAAFVRPSATSAPDMAYGTAWSVAGCRRCVTSSPKLPAPGQS